MNHERVRGYLPSGRDILVLPHLWSLREQFLLYLHPLSPSSFSLSPANFYLLPSFGPIHLPSLIFVCPISIPLPYLPVLCAETFSNKWIISALLRVCFYVFPEAGANIAHILDYVIVDWWNLESLWGQLTQPSGVIGCSTEILDYSFANRLSIKPCTFRVLPDTRLTFLQEGLYFISTF
jgi:hypothetical protein